MARASRYLKSLTSSPAFNYCPRCLHLRQQQPRPFSSTSTRAMPKPQRSTNTSTKSNARKSRKVEMMNLSASEIPEDLGLLPQTFIRPPNRDMPRLFGKSWKARLRTEMMWMKSRLQNFAGCVVSKWIGTSHSLHNLRLTLRILQRFLHRMVAQTRPSQV